MQAKRLPNGGTIGIICPSKVADAQKYAPNIATIQRLGYHVKLGANISKNTYGYTASAQERADDLNAMVADPAVSLILFGGGDGAAEVLPYIDYDAIRRSPKLFSSYSDGTSILNAIHAQTGLVTYYGYGAGEFADLRYYDYLHFHAHFAEGGAADTFIKGCEWKTLSGGTCEGTLIGGYALLFGLMLSNRYFCYDKNRRYLLFLEDNAYFSPVGAVAEYLAFIAQSEFFQNVTGLIFGQYAADTPDELLRCLERFGAHYGIPVVYTDDFGHGTQHAILPIGRRAALDADRQTLHFL